MNDKTLFFCRTPLQAIIINKLLENISGNHHIIYRPNNNSQKHQHYFNKIKSDHKTFLVFEPLKFSHALSSIYDWFSLSRDVRMSKYNQLFIASIGDMVFSFFAERNSTARINLFDDGMFNLSKVEFNQWVESDSVNKKITRTLFLGEKPLVTHNRINHHYTIYPSELCWLNCHTTELKGLFKINNTLIASPKVKKKKLRIILGSAYFPTEIDRNMNRIEKRNIQHEAIINSDKFDVYIPHPSHPSKPKYIDELNQLFEEHPINLMIAEDLISAICRSGYEVIVYGFGSSTIANLSKDFKTIGIMLDEQMMSQYSILRKLGAKIIKLF